MKKNKDYRTVQVKMSDIKAINFMENTLPDAQFVSNREEKRLEAEGYLIIENKIENKLLMDTYGDVWVGYISYVHKDKLKDVSPKKKAQEKKKI